MKNTFSIYAVLLLSAFSFSCEKAPINNDTVGLSFVESSLPVGNTSKDGDTISIMVNWAYTEWKIIIGEVEQGVGFIAMTSPTYGGDINKGPTTTSIDIITNANENLGINTQEIYIESLYHDLADTIILNQDAGVEEDVVYIIDPSIEYQKISGFGGANAIWGTDYLNSRESGLAFGTGEGNLGLSILRVRLSSNKSDWAGLVSSVKKAKEYNATIIASPWSPPANFKSNSSTNGGGYLLYDYYDDFIAYINDFIQYMDGQGAGVDVVSLQNEPDYQVSYEGCEYSSTEMFNLVRDYASGITGAKVCGVESYRTNKTYTDLILNDFTAVNNLDIVGGHLYGTPVTSYPLAAERGKELWMTEHLLNLNSGQNPDNWTVNTPAGTIWAETLEMAEEIHDCMTNNWNAYIWWYIRRYYSFLGDGTNGTSRGEILKRGFAMAQFSKFIRPGYVRIGIETDPEAEETGLMMSAYKGFTDYVVVFINNTDTSVDDISLKSPGLVSSAESYTTNLTLDMEKQPLTPVGQNVVVSIDAQSIKTVVIRNN